MQHVTIDWLKNASLVDLLVSCTDTTNLRHSRGKWWAQFVVKCNRTPHYHSNAGNPGQLVTHRNPGIARGARMPPQTWGAGADDAAVSSWSLLGVKRVRATH